jgi:hypothetical protein
MVQIFQNEELNDVLFQVEALDEWKEIANSLGMNHQLDFVKSAESPLPYPYVNKSMGIIFSTLCPTKIDFKKYDKTPIPLEVMRQIAFSVKEKHFQEIEIWFDDKSPDPFAIGRTHGWYIYDKSYNRLKGGDGIEMLFYTEEEAKAYAELVTFPIHGTGKCNIKEYAIARWADELRPIAELKELAKERLMERYAAVLKNEINERTQALKQIAENVVLYLNGELSESQLKGGKW